MPQFDGRGPAGEGPRTGRGLGPCGRVMGRGFGGGMGWGTRGRFASPKNELAALEEEKMILEEELTAISDEIKALKQ